MGEALSKKWGHDPAYNEATEILTRSNKNTQQFVNKILTESNKLEAKNKELEKEIAKLQASIELKKTPSRDKLNQASSQEEPQLARTKLNRGHSEELPQLARAKLNRGHSEDQHLARRAKLSRGPSQEGLLLDGCLNKLHNLVGENETLKQENDKLRKDIKVLSDEKESALSRLAEEKEKGIEHQHKFKVEISNLKIEIDRADAKFREVVRDYETLNSRYKKQQDISSSERCQFQDELKDLRLKLDEKSSKFVDSRWGQEQKPEQTSVKEFAKNTGQAQVCVHYGDFLKEKSEQLANDFLQLHELYWKQAMTELGESGNEKTNIEFLLTILQNAYSFSAHMETRFREEFEQVLLDVSTRIKEVVDTTLLVREILEKLTSSIKQLFIRDTKYQEYGTKGPAVQSYITEAVSICWLMVTRSPRVIISTAIPKESHSEFFNPYKKFGSKVDFVVWPVVKLSNDEGQIICRGTAVFK